MFLKVILSGLDIIQEINTWAFTVALPLTKCMSIINVKVS